MVFRYFIFAVVAAALIFNGAAPQMIFAQPPQGTGANQTGATPLQRLEVMRSRLETLRRTLNGAVAGLNSKDGGTKEATADDPRTRLRGLEKEVGSVLSDVNNLRGKQERAERYDTSELDKLETSVNDLNERVEAGLRGTAGERSAAGTNSAAGDDKKKKRGFFGRILGRGGDDEYDELVGTVAPGRDRQLFEEATAQARKDRFETARDLYNVIITAYPDSAYLPAAKLAIADTFYLEGTSSALIQSAASYRDWLTFFPTHPLSDDVMLKMAEVEMRKMGLADRDVSPARKAEQQLKVLMQQFPDTSLRPDAEIRLREVQENLALHNMYVGNQYFDRYFQGKAPNPKGAQSRYREIVEKYPNFSYMDHVLYRLGVTYVQEEEPDEAAKYFAQLARNHPNSEYAEKAREQLNAIGAAAPDPDPKKKDELPPERPGMRTQFFRELLGTTPVTVDKNGILITDSSKRVALIDEVIKNGGTLPVTTPTIPVPRTPPARPQIPVNTLTPASGAAKESGGLTVQPTRPGAPSTSSNLANPDATNQPATAPPPAATTTPKP
ncbi:MAG: outer membrane protein assembly factor BamD [Acidobacteriota bacterium]|nr:outer membrane protein assembly factor BamD [Acidobacteriota bacterium]